MSFNKTIQMCIFNGNPNGRIMCELSNWNGRVYKISRNDLNEFANRPDSEFTGVYFLLGRDEENNDTVYIGEAERMIVRLKQHLKDHNYWKINSIPWLLIQSAQLLSIQLFQRVLPFLNSMKQCWLSLLKTQNCLLTH